MLDKSLPYIPIIMRREAGIPIPEHKLPPGFCFEIYSPETGESKNYMDGWVRIETSVGEFDSEEKAANYFRQSFLPYSDELCRRMLFAAAADGTLVGTATAWWGYAGKRRRPMVHWVAVSPGYQGLGIGKALISETLRLMNEIEGEGVYYLTTQTWSHKAIFIYEKAGFHITCEKNIFGKDNEQYEAAVKLIEALRAR